MCGMAAARGAVYTYDFTTKLRRKTDRAQRLHPPLAAGGVLCDQHDRATPVLRRHLKRGAGVALAVEPGDGGAGERDLAAAPEHLQLSACLGRLRAGMGALEIGRTKKCYRYRLEETQTRCRAYLTSLRMSCECAARNKVKLNIKT